MPSSPAQLVPPLREWRRRGWEGEGDCKLQNDSLCDSLLLLPETGQGQECQLRIGSFLKVAMMHQPTVAVYVVEKLT
jgi:hypothetical protein